MLFTIDRDGRVVDRIQGAFCADELQRGGAQGDPLSGFERGVARGASVARARGSRSCSDRAGADRRTPAPPSRRRFTAARRRPRRAARRAAARPAVRAAGAAAVPRPRARRVALRAADLAVGVLRAPSSAIDEESLKLLGLLRPATDLARGARVGRARSRCWASTTTARKRLVVIREPGRDAAAARDHARARAGARARGPALRAATCREGVPDDAALAETALAEGTATALMVDYAERYLSLGDAARSSRASRTARPLPPFLEKLLLFPYLEGEQFVDEFRGERGSWQAVDAHLPLPPAALVGADPAPAPLRAGRAARARVRAPPLATGARARLAAAAGDVAGRVRPAAAVRPRRAARGRPPAPRAGPEGASSCGAAARSARIARRRAWRATSRFMRVRWDTRARPRRGRAAARAGVGAGAARQAARRAGAWSSRGGAIVMAGRGRRDDRGARSRRAHRRPRAGAARAERSWP